MSGGFWSMFYSEDNKTWSSQRVIAVGASVVWTLAICFVWVALSFKKGEIQAINDSITLIYSSVLGIVLGTKVINSIFAEKVSSTKDNIPTESIQKD